jgi:hypothetical protein
MLVAGAVHSIKSGLSMHVPLSVPDRFCGTVNLLGSGQIELRIATRFV